MTAPSTKRENEMSEMIRRAVKRYDIEYCMGDPDAVITEQDNGDYVHLNDYEELLEAYKAALTQQEAEPVEPYAYLRMLDGRAQISVGPICPPDRAGGYATPWGAVYLHPPKPAALPQPVVSVPQDVERHVVICTRVGIHDSHYECTCGCAWDEDREVEGMPPCKQRTSVVAQDVEKFIAGNKVKFYQGKTLGTYIDTADLRTFLAQRDAGCVRVPWPPTEAMIIKGASVLAPQSTNVEAMAVHCFKAMLTASKEGV